MNERFVVLVEDSREIRGERRQQGRPPSSVSHFFVIRGRDGRRVLADAHRRVEQHHHLRMREVKYARWLIRLRRTFQLPVSTF